MENGHVESTGQPKASLSPDGQFIQQESTLNQ